MLGAFRDTMCGKKIYPGTQDYGNWNSIFVKFRRLAKAGFWEKLAANLTDCPDLEWVMIDAATSKCISMAWVLLGEPRMHGEPKEV